MLAPAATRFHADRHLPHIGGGQLPPAPRPRQVRIGQHLARGLGMASARSGLFLGLAALETVLFTRPPPVAQGEATDTFKR